MEKGFLSWAAAYAYLAYTLVGQVPFLYNPVFFGLAATSGLFVVVYLFHSYINLGWKNASMYLAIAVVVSYLMEFVGTQVGIPFGSYYYTIGAGPILGPVPVFIPLLWAALGYFSVAAAGDYITASILMVLLDVSFDPLFSQYLWHWVAPGQYFGVPLTNFVGWFVTALAIYAVFYLTSRRKFESSLVAIGFYFLLGIDNAVTDVELGLAQPGVISLALFAGASLLLFLRIRRPQEAPSVEKTRPRETPDGAIVM